MMSAPTIGAVVWLAMEEPQRVSGEWRKDGWQPLTRYLVAQLRSRG